MKIKLITQAQYNTLVIIMEDHKNLTYQNKGYDGINIKALPEEDQQAVKEIEAILKDHICGFQKFQNFRLTIKDQQPQIRFQYNWGASDNSMYFIGVGYIKLTELLNGFED